MKACVGAHFGIESRWYLFQMPTAGIRGAPVRVIAPFSMYIIRQQVSSAGERCEGVLTAHITGKKPNSIHLTSFGTI